MSTKVAITFFWLTFLAIVLVPIILSIVYYLNTNTSTPHFIKTHTSFPLQFISRMLDENGLENFPSPFANVVNMLYGHRHHHHYKNQDASCIDSSPLTWKSELIALYSVSLVITVDLNGCGNFTRVQEAVDAVPDFSPSITLIAVFSGTYREKVSVNVSKINLIIEGQGYLNTTIAWNDNANSTGQTSTSFTFSIQASNFKAYNISFRNTAPAPDPGIMGAQAVALRVSGDKAAFYGCGMYGHQDTLSDDYGRHYFRDCWIEGSIDFIFGNARSFYEHCVIHSVAKEAPHGISGCITAQSRNSLEQKTGFSFVHCNVQGYGKIWLGRAWGNYSTVVFSKSFMSDVIIADGWNDWGVPSKDSKIFFGEYDNDGTGADTTGRVSYAKQLDDGEVAQFLNISYIDGETWLPPGTSDGNSVVDPNLGDPSPEDYLLQEF